MRESTVPAPFLWQPLWKTLRELPKQKEKAAKFTQIIKDLGGDVKSSEFWGLRNLAYVIRKNRKAHYVMLNIELPGNQIAELERRSRIDEDVIRFLNVRVPELATTPSVMMKKNTEEEVA